ncbi:MAG: TVP38/TMEM64 family protein, partial [Nitrospiria bacterium]
MDKFNEGRIGLGGRLHWFKLSILLIFVGVMSLIIWQTGGVYWFDPKGMARTLQDVGKLAPIVYVLLRMIGVVVLLPSIPLDGVGGVAFGPVFGTVYSVLGSGMGALISFYIAHSLGREAMTRLLHKDISFCDRC